MSATTLEDKPELKPTGDGSGDLTHIIADTDWEKGYIFGEKVEALCGHKWVPHKDPKNFPVCQVCEDIFESHPGFHFARDE
jgi:hypothetical protein